MSNGTKDEVSGKVEKGAGVTRRTVLTTAVAGLGTVMAKGPAGAAEEPDPAIDAPKDQRRAASEAGQRSPFEKPHRLVEDSPPASWSHTPLQDLNGYITPSDLHYESHSSGIPEIDPDKYELRIEGSVERPLTLTLKDLKRFPVQTEARYLECAGNGVMAFAGMVPELTPQQIDGMVSTSVWTGTYFSSLLDAVRPTAEVKWFSAEGHDGSWVQPVLVDERLRSSLIVWGQNGEALRPEQGYPARLLLAGIPGPPNVKWLSRIEFNTSAPPDGVDMTFSEPLGAKSIILYPAYPNVLSKPGELVVSGLAWSGRGKISQVDISADGGQTWNPAELQQPGLPLCQTRFRYRWNWDGNEALLMSRATDETGDVQVSLEEARAAQQAHPEVRHYFSNIRAWAIAADGTVTFGLS